MKLNFKNILFSIGIFVFAFGFFAVSKVSAVDTVVSTVFQDTDFDGTVETFRVEMDEDVVSCVASPAGIVMGAGAIGLASVGDVSCTGTDHYFYFEVITTPGITGGVGDPAILFMGGDITLTSGPATMGMWSFTDAAAPAPISAVYEDTDFNGQVDQATITMSTEIALVLGAYNDGEWMITEEGFVGLADETLVAVAGNTLVVTALGDAGITGGAVNPEILYTNGTGALTDGLTNPTETFGGTITPTAIAATDAAAPVILSGAYTDEDDDGAVDTIVFTTSADAGLACTAYADTDMTVDDPGTVTIVSSAGDICGTNTTTAFAIILATVGTPFTTGGTTDPIVTYTQPGNGLEDGEGNDVPTILTLTLDDEAAPIVLGTLPTDISVGQSRTNPVGIAFSETMDTTLVPNSLISSPSVAYTTVWEANPITLVPDSILVGVHTVAFRGGTTYAITITGLTDAAAVPNAFSGDPYTWHFRTEGSSGGSSSGSMASSTYLENNNIVLAPTVPTTPPTDCQSGYLFSPSTGKSCTTPTSPTDKFTFTKTLKYLTIDSEVKELQEFLNTHGYVVAATGAGSLGNETTKFGALTKAAVIKFQLANKISPTLGYFGPVTRGVVNGM